MDDNLWNYPNPFGGFDTSKPPHEGKFKKESVFYLFSGNRPYGAKTMVSLCFSNHLRWNRPELIPEIPEGLAIRSVSIYRVKSMPELPSKEALAPEGPRRHITTHLETCSPWALSQFPKLAGYNTIGVNQQSPAQFLNEKTCFISRPDWQATFHAGTLESQRWLFDNAARHGVYVKINLGWLLDLGFEGTDYDSFMGVGSGGVGGFSESVPLSPTKEELIHIAKALDRSLSALSQYKSFADISVEGSAQSFFTKRNMDDFRRETGLAFDSSPAPIQNTKTLLNSPRETVDAWIKWSCRKRFEFLSWLLRKARNHRPDIYLTINQSWYINGFQLAYFNGFHLDYFGTRPILDNSTLREKGVNNFHDFLRLICHDPALYAGDDGFVFAMEQERGYWGESGEWPSPYKEQWFDKIRDGFGGGLSIQSFYYDEGAKPLKGWTCHYLRDHRSFRRDLVEALLYANARDFVLGTYSIDPYRGRLDDLRTFAVPFQLLPFVKPAAYDGKLSDSARQAVIKKYGGRYGLMNAGDLSDDIVLTLPAGKTAVIDLSNGVRQPLLAARNQSGGSEVQIHLKPWSLKTLEIK